MHLVLSRRFLSTSVLAVCLGLAAAYTAGEAPLTLEDVVAAARFDERQHSDLLAGKIVTANFDEASDKEMSILVALKVPRSLPQVLQGMKGIRELDFDQDLIAVGKIGVDQDASEALAGIAFNADEGDEIRRLLDLEPGAGLNLSLDEIARFGAVAERYPKRDCENDSACLSAVNETYRSVLAGRLRAYRQGGIDAVENYARGRGRVAEPREELRLAASELPLMSHRVPKIYQAWLEYPRAQPPNSDHQFLWLKRNVEGRPTFVLAHRAIYKGEHAIFSAERHFYVGQSYNSLQMASYASALGAESVGILLSRTSTDRVAGFGTSAKKKIGRAIVRKALVGTYERLLAALQ